MAIVAFERMKRDGRSRHTAWGPSAAAKQGNNINMGLGGGFGIRSLRASERAAAAAAAGRLSGGRAGPGTGPWSAAAASPRLDDAGTDAGLSRGSAGLSLADDDVRQLRAQVAEMGRKLDELLAQG